MVTATFGKFGSTEEAAPSDFDGNGMADFLWRNTNSGVVELRLMNGLLLRSVSFPGGTLPDWDVQ